MYFYFLDSLKAFSIISVVIYNFKTNVLPSGFLAIDVFLVISGFLMSARWTHILRSKEELGTFYVQRLKRIYIPLLVCILFCSLIYCLFNDRPYNNLINAIFSLFGIINLTLSFESYDYFSDNNYLNIFKHLWSLSLELQFYLIFPILAWAWLNGKKYFVYGIILLSLILYFISFEAFPIAGYYLLPTRFWEFGLGFLSYQFRLQNNHFSLSGKNIFILVVLLLICFFIPESWIAYSRLLMVTLSCLLMFVLEKRQPISYLNFKPLLLVGRYSYSIYLYHYPFILFSFYVFKLNYEHTFYILMAILFVSVISVNYLETNSFIDRMSKKELFSFITSSSVVFSLALYLLSFDNNKIFYQGHIKTPRFDWFSGRNYQARCHISYDENLFQTSVDDFDCSINDPSIQNKIFVAGDSYSLMLGAIYYETVRIKKYNIDVKSAYSCLYPYSFDYSFENFSLEELNICKKFSNLRINSVLAAMKKNDVLFIASNLAHYLSNDNATNMHLKIKRFNNKKILLNKKDAIKLYISSLEKIILKVGAKSAFILLMTPLWSFEREISNCYSNWFQMKKSEQFLKSCDIEKDIILQNRKELMDELVNLSLKYNHFKLWDPLNDLCPESTCRYKTRNNVFIFADVNHTSLEGNQKLIPSFMNALEGLKKQNN